jgi:archaemetzincin
MTGNRFRRSSFPGTEPARAEEPFDLPPEPLPPDPVEIEDRRPATNAPIVLIPVGKLEDGLFEKLAPILEESFRRPTQIHGALPVPKYAYNPTRSQYHSAAILKRVETLRTIEWDAAIGVVDVDLFVPEVPFIFGEADRSTRSAIISLTRLRPEGGAPESKRDLLLKRLVCEAIHQVGLIRGLAQCPNNRCVMFYSATVQDTDKKGHAFCANCRKRLLAEC